MSTSIIQSGDSHTIKIEPFGSNSHDEDHLKQSHVTIYKVPESFRHLNPSAYQPGTISIGPIHFDDKILKDGEVLKGSYMFDLFRRIRETTGNDTFNTERTCLEVVEGLLPRARACYEESSKSTYGKPLTQMMVKDGCFILELLYKNKHGITDGDPVFDNITKKNSIKFDLLLLENQIPFFILEALFHITINCIDNSISLIDLIVYFFNDTQIIYGCNITDTILINSPAITEESDLRRCHILALLQTFYRPPSRIPGHVPAIAYSATEIAETGVTFVAQAHENFLLSVIFKQSPLVSWWGNLIIPPLCINQSTSSLVMNLIAFEQCVPFTRQHVTSLFLLIGKLIHNVDDVSLLVSSKVFYHNLATTEDVKSLFSNISNSVIQREFYYCDEWKQLHGYCNCFWPRILVASKRLNSRLRSGSTWKSLLLIAAVILFAFTLILTIRND